MSADEPISRTFDLPAGRFRGLEWSGGPDTAVFLHGLSGMADVWDRTVVGLGHRSDPSLRVTGRGPGPRDDHIPRCVAIDQRGHGRSPITPGRYSAGDYLADLMALVDVLGSPVRLIGHSMGARIAMIAAARRPERFSSVVIVDIGPEAWRGNIEATTALLSMRPERFADRDEALAVARFIVGERGEAAAEEMVDDRLRREEDGSYTWLSPLDALVDSVTVQRSRNYWSDWDRIDVPSLLIRGGDSDELRPHIAEKMRRRNPGVQYAEIDDVGHNIPMLAPERLAGVIGQFWRDVR